MIELLLAAQLVCVPQMNIPPDEEKEQEIRETFNYNVFNTPFRTQVIRYTDPFTGQPFTYYSTRNQQELPHLQFREEREQTITNQFIQQLAEKVPSSEVIRIAEELGIDYRVICYE